MTSLIWIPSHYYDGEETVLNAYLHANEAMAAAEADARRGGFIHETRKVRWTQNESTGAWHGAEVPAPPPGLCAVELSVHPRHVVSGRRATATRRSKRDRRPTDASVAKLVEDLRMKARSDAAANRRMKVEPVDPERTLLWKAADALEKLAES